MTATQTFAPITARASGATPHRTVSREDWLAARKALLAEEKAFTQARDALARKRLELPWVRINKDYVFDGPHGKEALADLFGGKSQLIVQHFMFTPGWSEGCVGCSFNADHVDGALPHLSARDVSFVVISRAPLADLEAFKKRMGWRFKWVSSGGGDFNYDFGVSFRKEDLAAGSAVYNYRPLDAGSNMEDLSGYSFFYRNAADEIFHSYSTFGRGDEMLGTAYMYLDMVPKGRDEDGLEDPTSWWRHHDKYEEKRANADACSCHSA